ncbi:MAG: hypothetical protein J6N67_03565 [Desulfovibrio sp.]|nr:hypothetical protein [Desulfovibrio sp.]
MITRIWAKSFKGLDFDQALDRRSLITGPVGSGKSSRALALTLAVTGELRGTGVAKSNADIYCAVSSGPEMAVGIEIDGETTLERIFKRKKDGGVTCAYRCCGEPTPKQSFDGEVNRAGIVIADVPAFLRLSAAKKIDELFRLFPPSGDLRKISAAIVKAKARLLEIDAEMRGRQQSEKNLAEVVANFEMPEGNLPVIQAEIAKLERELIQAREERTREATRLEMEDAVRRKAETVTDGREATAREGIDPAPAQSLPLFGVSERPPQAAAAVPAASPDDNPAAAALERVLSALKRAGCESCAARMVLRREIHNLRANTSEA